LLGGVITQNRFLAPNEIKSTRRLRIIEMLGKAKMGCLGGLIGILGGMGLFWLG